MNNVQDVQTLSDTLISYLRAELGNPALDFAAPLVRLQGGYETSTYRFELDGAPHELERPLVLRLFPRFYGTGSAIWESTVQNGLARERYPVAQVYVVCTDMSVLGGAFFVMDHLPGRSLADAPQESVPGLLGKTHAELHDIDPNPIIKALADKGIAEHDYSLPRRFDWLCDRADKLPWIRRRMDWLGDIALPNRRGRRFATVISILLTFCMTGARSPVSWIGAVLHSDLRLTMWAIRWC